MEDIVEKLREKEHRREEIIERMKQKKESNNKHQREFIARFKTHK